MDADPEEATLVFHEQEDGRKVSRLPGGKVVLVELDSLERVRDGELWHVRLRHKETFAIAEPVDRVAAVSAEGGGEAAAATAEEGAVAVTERGNGRAPDAPEATPPAEKPRESTAFKIEGMLIEPVNFLRADDRVALFIDGPNMDAAARDAGYQIDYRKVRDYFAGPGTYYAGFYYIADYAGDGTQQRFLDFLSYSGYIVRRKPVKVIHDHETGERILKGNLDTEMALDMLNTVGNYDVAFLFTGDSDFERAVDLLRSRGKRVYVVTSKRTLSRELAFVADKPIFLIEDFQSVLERT